MTTSKKLCAPILKDTSMEQAKIFPAPEIVKLKSNTKICKSFAGYITYFLM